MRMPYLTLRRAAGALAVAVVAVAVVPASGDVITTDTYIDSYDATSYGLAKNTTTNYGGSAATKVTTSAGSSSFPLATSATRTLLTLPNSFWTAVGTQQVSSAVVTFRIRNFNNNEAFTRSVGAYPLTHAFTAGTGYQPTVPGGTVPGTMGGVENTPGGATNGADWLTYDGTNSWGAGAAGGAYDAANVAVGVINVGTFTTMSWDIKNLVNNPATRAEVKNFGLLIRIADDLNFPTAAGTQQFLSYYSSEGAAALPTSMPAVNFAVVPEPGTAGLVTVAAAGLLRRRRRQLGAA